MKLLSCVLLLSGLAAPASGPTIRFDDIQTRSGVNFVLDNSATPEKHQPETMIAGVAAFDYNNDGFMDLFFVNGAKLPEMDKSNPKYWNRLYRNNGDETFTDVTEKAGVKGLGYGMGGQRATTTTTAASTCTSPVWITINCCTTIAMAPSPTSP